MINPVAGKNGLSGSNSLVWMPPAAHLPPPAPKEDLWAGADPTSGLMLHSAIGLKSWHKTSVRLPGGAGPAQSGLAGEHGPRWTREADDASGDPAAPAMHPGEEADHDSDRLARESPAMRPPPGQADGPIVLAVAAPGTAGRPEMMSAGFRRPGVLASARPHEGAASTDIAGYNLHPIREAPSASVRANSPGASTAISIAVSIPPAARSPALPILLLFHAGQTRYEGAPSFGPPSLDGSMADGTDDGLDGGLSKSLPAVPQRDTRYKKLVVGGMDDSVGSVAVERLYYPPGPVMTATPEPATCCLLACALACGLPRRRGGKLVARASRP
jgi:hypothetical protein